MSLNTTKPADPKLPVFAATVKAALFGGAKAFAVSAWFRSAGRGDDHGMLFGNSEDNGNQTNAFNLNFSSQTRFSFRVALQTPDGGRNYAVVTTSPNALAGAWNHLEFRYTGDRLAAYINGVPDLFVGTTGLPLWTPGSDYAIQLRGNALATSVDFGGIAVWRDVLPSREALTAYRRGGPLPDGAILDLRNWAAAPIEMPSGTPLADRCGHDMIAQVGGGVLTPETAGMSPSIVLDSATVMPSGQQVETVWKTVSGGTNFAAAKADGLDPIAAIRREEEEEFGPDVPLLHQTCKGNVVRWVLPPEVRPTSDVDMVLITFPRGLIEPNAAQFSAAAELIAANDFGHVRYPLPPSPRAKLVAQAPVLSHSTPQYTRIDMARLLGAWRNGTTLDERGIPIACPGKPNDVVNASLYAWEGGSPAGGVLVLWRGSDTSDVSLSGLEIEVGGSLVFQDQDWRYRLYELPGKGVMVHVSTDANGNTGLTDLMIVREDHWGAFALGEQMAREFLDTYQSIDMLRWMDAMYAIPGNVATIEHVVPEKWLSAAKTLDYSAKIITVEKYTDPAGYFPGDCTTVLVTTDGPHNLYNGQYARIDMPLPAKPLAVCVRTDHLPENQVECRIDGTGFDPAVLFGRTISVTVQCLPHPALVAAVHNELYEAWGRCKVCWVNRPHGSTDELWTRYLSELDKRLHPEIEIRAEYTNESYGYSTEQIVRYCVGEGKRLGLSEHQYYSTMTYRNWQLSQAAVTSGRKYGVICAGQTVNPSVLDKRMTAMTALGPADVWMSVTTYHDQPPIDGVNRDGLLALGAAGVAENYDFGQRDYSAYARLKAKFGVPLVAYEGGFAMTKLPEGDVALFRAFVAAAMTYETAQQTWRNFTLAQEAGFDAVCLLPLRGRAQERQRKFWACAIGFAQQPGLDNPIVAVEQYRVDGLNVGQFASVRLWAANEWAAQGDQYGVVEYAVTATMNDGETVAGPARATIEEAAQALITRFNQGDL